MGLRNDYIKRLVEELGISLVRVRGLDGQGEIDQALWVMEEGFSRLLSLDTPKIGLLTAETLLQWCQARSASDPQVCLLVGEMLAEAAGLHAVRGDEVLARDLASKGLHFLAAAHGMEDVPWGARHAEVVQELLGRLEGCSLHGRTRLEVMGYWEREGQYAQAEDLLFDLLEDAEAGVPQGELLEKGTGFYTRLLGQSDEALAAGNLPRDEVLEGQAALSKRQGQRS